MPLKIPPKALPLETARALPLTRKPLKRLDLNFMFLFSQYESYQPKTLLKENCELINKLFTLNGNGIEKYYLRDNAVLNSLYCRT